MCLMTGRALFIGPFLEFLRLDPWRRPRTRRHGPARAHNRVPVELLLLCGHGSGGSSGGGIEVLDELCCWHQ